MSAILRRQLDGSLLLCDLRKVFLELDKECGMTDEELSAALRRHHLVLSREPPKPRARPYTVTIWEREK